MKYISVIEDDEKEENLDNKKEREISEGKGIN
jgi:hypothetical protein